MTWTKEKPKQRGFYWWRVGNDRPSVMFIDRHGRVYSLGVEAGEHLMLLINDGEWWGPIEEPSKE
jgi:hypothetical protein